MVSRPLKTRGSIPIPACELARCLSESGIETVRLYGYGFKWPYDDIAPIIDVSLSNRDKFAGRHFFDIARNYITPGRTRLFAGVMRTPSGAVASKCGAVETYPMLLNMAWDGDVHYGSVNRMLCHLTV